MCSSSQLQQHAQRVLPHSMGLFRYTLGGPGSYFFFFALHQSFHLLCPFILLPSSGSLLLGESKGSSSFRYLSFLLPLGFVYSCTLVIQTIQEAHVQNNLLKKLDVLCYRLSNTRCITLCKSKPLLVNLDCFLVVFNYCSVVLNHSQ